MKILTVVGARPQFIKAATVSRVIKSMSDVNEVIVHTGQHFDKNMSDIFFDEMCIPKPHYNLEIASLSHGAMTGRMLESVENLILEEQPDWVLVYGDTNSTLAGALAASKLKVKVAHVEAGLRSFNMNMPEEQNRILTDRISNVLFCPTQLALRNLHREGYRDFPVDIHVIGDVMYDAALFYGEKAVRPKDLPVNLESGGFVLATVHRAENTDDDKRLSEIVNGLNRLNNKLPVILPLHPRTAKKIQALKLKLNVSVIAPVGYLGMVYLLQNCRFVVSDSGGVQKEAYFFEKQCLVLRDETEWQELVEHGTNIIVGANATKLIEGVNSLNKDHDYSVPFYGNGQSANKIIDKLRILTI